MDNKKSFREKYKYIHVKWMKKLQVYQSFEELIDSYTHQIELGKNKNKILQSKDEEIKSLKVINTNEITRISELKAEFVKSRLKLRNNLNILFQKDSKIDFLKSEIDKFHSITKEKELKIDNQKSKIDKLYLIGKKYCKENELLTRKMKTQKLESDSKIEDLNSEIDELNMDKKRKESIIERYKLEFNKLNLISIQNESKIKSQQSEIDILKRENEAIADFHSLVKELKLENKKLKINLNKIQNIVEIDQTELIGYEKKIFLDKERKVRKCLWKRGDHKIDVAVKIIDKFEFDKISSLRYLNNPSIQKVFGYVKDSGYGYGNTNSLKCKLVMEYVDGFSLFEFLHDKKYKKILEKENSSFLTWSLFKKSIEGVSYLHSRDPIVVHRDIKSKNFIVSKDLNELKLSDFNMAKIKKIYVETLGTTTKACWEIYGPEVFKTLKQKGILKLNVKSDIFALGIVLYEILTGNFLYEEFGILKGNLKMPSYFNYMNSMIDIDPDKLQFPSKYVKDIPKQLKDIVKFCLEGDPKKRKSALF